MQWIKRWDVWSGVIGIAGLIFAAYTYIVTHQVGRISYSYETQKVFDPTSLSNFVLNDGSGKPVVGPVYATNFVIWNSGDLSLSDGSDRIREPIKIAIKGQIFYFIINKVNLVDQNNFHIALSPDQRSVTLQWKFFDPSQAIRITLVHSDSSAPSLEVTGRFFGASITREDKLRLSDNAGDVIEKSISLFLGLGAFMIVVAIFIAAMTYRRSRRTDLRVHERTSRMTKRGYLMAGFGIFEGLMFAGLWVFVRYIEIHPPI